MGPAAPLALVLALTAQPPVNEPATGWTGVGQDLSAVGTRVAQPSRRGRVLSAWIISGTAFLYMTRHELRDFMQDHRSERRTDIYDAARLFSRGAVAPLAAAGLAAAGRWGNDSRRVTGARRLLTACGGAVLTAGVAQIVVATERPEDGDGVRLFAGDGHSVSTDASLAACLVDPLPAAIWPRDAYEPTRRRRARAALKGFLMTGAVLTALQRMDADKHWAPDVFLGVANGLAWGRWLAGPRAAVPPPVRRVSWSLTPGGVSLRVRLGRGSFDVDSAAVRR